MGHPSIRKLAEVADQDYVAGFVEPGEEQLLAVARPGEVGNKAGGEFSELLRRSAGQGLFPDVRSAVSGQNVLERFSGRRPAKTARTQGHLGYELQRSAGGCDHPKFRDWNRAALLVSKRNPAAIG